jgi:tetratricopeptide (TPR) repeat protein
MTPMRKRPRKAPPARFSVTRVESLIEKLRKDLVARRVRAAFERLSLHRQVVERLTPETPRAAELVGQWAIWVDAGFPDSGDLKRVVARFPAKVRAKLQLAEYAQLRLAEGFVAMKDEALGEAIGHLDFVLGLGDDVQEPETTVMAYFWKSQCHRKSGEYDAAMAAVLAGERLARELGYEALAATLATVEGWILFQKGSNAEALATLQAAETTLKETDDETSLGNILSAYGRIAQAEGEHERAVEHFAASIERFARVHPQHRNLARSLGNLAYVKRLMARQLRRRIDSSAAQRRRGGGKEADANGYSAAALGSVRTYFERLQAEALQHLDQAAAIYRIHRQRRGEGTLKITYGHIFLDNGDFDRAGNEAAAAYDLGREKEDFILMARARLLSCMVENAKLEEGVSENGLAADPSRHAHLAERYAVAAVKFAEHTQNQQLLARTHIWLGLTQSNEHFGDMEAARHSLNLALGTMKADPYQPHWDDLKTLKKRVIRGGSVDETLRSWSQGSVGDKTFREISDEFAELIIPKIWEREDRKIARVARKLSISPKKVRRTLIRTGTIEQGTGN